MTVTPDVFPVRIKEDVLVRASPSHTEEPQLDSMTYQGVTLSRDAFSNRQSHGDDKYFNSMFDLQSDQAS